MKKMIATKTRVNTKVAVAVLAAGVLFAAAIAGGIGLRNTGQQSLGTTPGYAPGYQPVKIKTIKKASESMESTLQLLR